MTVDRVLFPTVFLAADNFGARVLERTSQVLDRVEPRLSIIKAPAQELGGRLLPEIERLLRAEGGDQGQTGARLDLVLYASAEEGELVPACEAVAHLLAERFAPMFPANAPPNQRGAALQVVVRVPPAGAPGSKEALLRVKQLEDWAKVGFPHPVLARIWLVSLMTEKLKLSEQELVASAAAFGIACFLSGARQHDAVQSRLVHPSGEGRVTLLATASKDLPIALIADYAAHRVAFDGLRHVVDRVGAHPFDASTAEAAVSSLPKDSDLADLVDKSPAARNIRTLVASVSGAEAQLPSINVRSLEHPDSIRSRYRVLFDKATRPREATHVEGAKFRQSMEALDAKEMETVEHFKRQLEVLFETQLAPTDGLKRLPEIEAGLEQRRQQLADGQETDDKLPLGVPDEDPGRDRLLDVFSKLPRPSQVWASAAAAGLGLSVAVALGLLAWNAPPPVATAVSSLSAPVIAGQAALPPVATAPPSTLQLAMPWLLLVASLLGGAVAWAWMIGKVTRKELVQVLRDRREAVDALWTGGGGSSDRIQQDFHIRLRVRRVRLACARELSRALAHLQAARQQLLQSRDLLQQAILERKVAIGPEAAQDDLSQLLAQGDGLHGPVVDASTLARWLSSQRRTPELSLLADRLVEAAWPREGERESSLLRTVPAAEVDRLVQFGQAETEELRTGNLLDDEACQEAAAPAFQGLAAAAGKLARICTPRTPEDDPVNGYRPGETLLVGPELAVELVGKQVHASGVTAEPVPSGPHVSRVVLLRTWEGLTVDQIIRGSLPRNSAGRP